MRNQFLQDGVGTWNSCRKLHKFFIRQCSSSFLVLPIMNVVIFFTAIIASVSGLECFTDFDERNKTCSGNMESKYVDDADECCDWSNGKAYATIKPRHDETIPCSSCKLIREKGNAVFCFQEIYWLGDRSCHELHHELSTIVDCCVYRGALANTHAQGFHRQKMVMNATIPTYSCTPCNESVVIANHWTAWDMCNVTCDGGYKRREKICIRDKISPLALCHGTSHESKNCNDHPCEQSDVTLVVVAVVLASILIIICCIFILVKSSKLIKRLSNSNRYPAIDSVVFHKNNTHPGGAEALVQSSRMKSTPQTPRYLTGRRTLPGTPPTDGPEPLHEILKGTSAIPRHVSNIDNPEAHTYASIEKTNYDNQSAGYMEMDAKRN